jgi:hypothetical protein
MRGGLAEVCGGGRFRSPPHFLKVNQQLTVSRTWCNSMAEKPANLFNEINKLCGAGQPPSLAGRVMRPRIDGLSWMAGGRSTRSCYQLKMMADIGHVSTHLAHLSPC